MLQDAHSNALSTQQNTSPRTASRCFYDSVLFSWNQADVGGFCRRMHTSGYQGFLCGTGLFEMPSGKTEGQPLGRVITSCLSGYLSVVHGLVAGPCMLTPQAKYLKVRWVYLISTRQAKGAWHLSWVALRCTERCMRAAPPRAATESRGGFEPLGEGTTSIPEGAHHD